MKATTHAKELVRLRTGRDVGPLLRDLYVDRRHTQEEIAEALGISRDTVTRWLGEYGISRTDRAPVVVSGDAA